MNSVKRSELKNKLDKLEELEEIRKFLNSNYKYTIKIKKYIDAFGEIISIPNRTLKVDKNVILEIVDTLVTYYENDVNEMLGDKNEN